MKKGFSLVEIMVVIVIMGVLAVIGVPKLFGVIAKARAAEVPVAAGAYVNLQNAFLNEFNGVGSWKDIGYGAPGGSDGKTEYFEYTGCINGTIPFDNMEPDMPGWQASNRSKLNYCGAGSAWAVVIDPAGEKEIEYRRLISSPECEALTVNWGSVGATVEGMCEATGELHVAEKDDDKPDTPQETSASSSASEPPSSSPGEPTQSSNSNTEQQQQGDCEALANSIKNDNGNKYGWVCVSECGTFAPPGKARNAGFTGNYKKKKQSPTCEKTSSGEENQASNSQTESSTSAQSSASVTPSTTTTTTTSSQSVNPTEPPASNPFPGYTGSKTPHAYNEQTDYCFKKEGDECTEWAEIYLGFDTPHNFNKQNDYCLGTLSTNGKSCDGQYRPKSECKTWEKKECKEWQTSP